MGNLLLGFSGLLYLFLTSVSMSTALRGSGNGSGLDPRSIPSHVVEEVIPWQRLTILVRCLMYDLLALGDMIPKVPSDFMDWSGFDLDLAERKGSILHGVRWSNIRVLLLSLDISRITNDCSSTYRGTTHHLRSRSRRYRLHWNGDGWRVECCG